MDGLGEVISFTPKGESRCLEVGLPDDLARFAAPKGSIAIDGVSLTVNTVDGTRCSINIIPHTLKQTTLGSVAPGDAVNVEVDMIARYVARLAEARKGSGNGGA